jgi:CRP/FNR family transcriptional regulator
MIEELKASYGHLFEDALLNEIVEVAILKELPEDDTLIDVGQYIKYMPLLLDGVIKILREDSDGDELLLYFLEKGETCAMTLSCCLGQSKSNIRAITETKTRLLMIPIQKMEEWTGKYKSWRNYVFNSYHERLMEMLETIDSIVFLKMDERLIKYLSDKVKFTKNNILVITHQEIAYDLHSSRVVISRLLKKMENEQLVKLNRNQITLL